MQDRKAPLIRSRPWRTIAREISEETDPMRVLELSHELNCALDEQLGAIPGSGPDGSARLPMQTVKP